MKKHILSTLTALALAVPLGIGGLTLTAPVIATDADANEYEAAGHHYTTCSVDVSWRCHERIQAYVAEWGHTFGYTSRALPSGSDGADGQAYDYLKSRIDSGTLHEWNQALWEDGFNTIFPDGMRPQGPEPLNIREYLNNVHRQLQGFHEGDTPEERLESFQETCERVGGLLTMRFQFDDQDWSANQCRVNTVEEDSTGDVDPDAPATIEIFHVSFNPGSLTPDAGDPFSDFSPPLFQVTPLGGFGTPGNENPFEGEERQVISDHRDRIVELQEEVTMHDEYIATMLEVQNRNSSAIRSNTESVGALNSRVDTFADDIQKNTAGIALAYAFPSAGLHYNESFRLSGGAGYFREEAAVAFGFTGRLSQSVTASGGVGLADGVSGARVEIGFGW